MLGAYVLLHIKYIILVNIQSQESTSNSSVMQVYIYTNTHKNRKYYNIGYLLRLVFYKYLFSGCYNKIFLTLQTLEPLKMAVYLYISVGVRAETKFRVKNQTAQKLNLILNADLIGASRSDCKGQLAPPWAVWTLFKTQ